MQLINLPFEWLNLNIEVGAGRGPVFVLSWSVRLSSLRISLLSGPQGSQFFINTLCFKIAQGHCPLSHVVWENWIVLHCWLSPTPRFKAHEDFRLGLGVGLPVSSGLPFGNSFWVLFLAKELCHGSCVQLVNLRNGTRCLCLFPEPYLSFMDFRISLPLLFFFNIVYFFILNRSFASLPEVSSNLSSN